MVIIILRSFWVILILKKNIWTTWPNLLITQFNSIMKDEFPSRKRFIALITAGISILIGILYLILIIVLDARGPMLPPPPEALGVKLVF